MNTISIIKMMGEFGGRFPRTQLGDIINYVSSMLSDQRIVFIQENKQPHAILFFSLGDDYNRFSRKKTWRYVEHDPDSHVLFIELIVCRKWTHLLRKQLEQLLLTRFPQIEEAHWDRWASWGDRHVTWRRRRIHV